MLWHKAVLVANSQVLSHIFSKKLVYTLAVGCTQFAFHKTRELHMCSCKQGNVLIAKVQYRTILYFAGGQFHTHLWIIQGYNYIFK